MRIVLMGTGPFAVPSFDAIVKKTNHDVVLVVTKPLSSNETRLKSPTNPVRDGLARWATDRRSGFDQ